MLIGNQKSQHSRENKFSFGSDRIIQNIKNHYSLKTPNNPMDNIKSNDINLPQEQVNYNYGIISSPDLEEHLTVVHNTACFEPYSSVNQLKNEIPEKYSQSTTNLDKNYKFNPFYEQEVNNKVTATSTKFNTYSKHNDNNNFNYADSNRSLVSYSQQHQPIKLTAPISERRENNEREVGGSNVQRYIDIKNTNNNFIQNNNISKPNYISEKLEELKNSYNSSFMRSSRGNIIIIINIRL